MVQKLTKTQWDARRKTVRALELPDGGVVRVELAGSQLALPVMLREFSTGSRGYSVSERLNTEHGAFQLNVTITQVGSGEYRPPKDAA